MFWNSGDWPATSTRSASAASMLGLALLASVIFGCGAEPQMGRLQATVPAPNGNQLPASSDVLRLAVTTSTRDTGLLDVLIPRFEAEHQVRVDVIAAGTGKALKLGEAGDVDVVLVHARSAEDQFMADGHGTRREDVMYNTFELLGPAADPANVRGLPPVEALFQVAAAGSRFVSRGDDSGTHQRELQLWSAGGSRPAWDGYAESGQGMGPTLIMADQMQAYVLADRGTYLATRRKIAIVPVAAQSDELRNPYGVLVVNPSGRIRINETHAQRLVDFLIAPATQTLIRDFQVDGESLFYPLHATTGQ